MPGFVAVDTGGAWVGLITYRLAATECEVISLNSLRPGVGIGSALIGAVREIARQNGCCRLWLMTTNDNMNALHFYQKRGFVLAALYPDALAEARRLKPEIPLTGFDGIPLRDEIELEMTL
jgi:GNAT superfamily N-acetyltransferase